MEFHAKTAVVISRQIIYNGVTPDISGDSVTLVFKRDPSAAVVTFSGDVAAGGANGIVVFDLDEADTDLAPGPYAYELVWDSLSYGERVAEYGAAAVLPRVE